MTVCFDVYTMPSGCDTIWVYPSQIHPPPPSGGGGGGSKHYIQVVPHRKKKRRELTDAEILVALGLL